MSQDHKYIDIDSALRQLMGQYPPEQGNYPEFLEKLADHDAKNMSIDRLFDRQLEFDTMENGKSWKRIIILVWFRRLRNATMVLLLFVSLFNAPSWIISDRSAHENAISNPSTQQHTVEDRVKSRQSSPQANDGPSHSSIVEPGKMPQLKRVQTIRMKPEHAIGQPGLEYSLSDDQAGISIESIGLKKYPSILYSIDSIRTIPYPGSVKLLKTRRPGSGYAGFVLGLHVASSFQTSASSIRENNPQTTNRNYTGLANNGRTRSFAVNYGLSVERSVFKGFGVSFGIHKLTVKQEQTTDYRLTEAPVYDIDGSIAGYINITPEQIKAHIDNRMDYVSIPVNILYRMNITRQTGLQVKLGSSMLGLVNRKTEKFDYRSLDLSTYDQRGSRISFNNIQYGFNLTRDLPHHLMLSLGFERQILHEVNALSDRTETVRSTINNLNISFQYKF